MRQTFYTFLVVAFSILFATGLNAQPRNCGDRTKIVAQLAKKYGETRQSVGLGKNNGVVETFASAETGTWTILMTMPNGLACLIAAGEAFETVEAEAAQMGDDT